MTVSFSIYEKYKISCITTVNTKPLIYELKLCSVCLGFQFDQVEVLQQSKTIDIYDGPY